MQHSEKKISFIKALLMAVAVIAVVGIIVILSTKILKLSNLWVTFMFLAICAATGISFSNIKDTLKMFIGCAVGLLTGFLLTFAPAMLGPWGIAIPGIIIFAMIICMVMQKLQYIFNGATALIMTVLAAGIHVQPSAMIDLSLGFALFGLLPFALSKLPKKEKV